MELENVNLGNAVGGERSATDLLDGQGTADRLEAQHVLSMTGHPPNPPRDIEDYYRGDRPSNEDFLVAGFILGALYLGALTVWRDYVKSRG